jgi:hypothetical protein
MTVWLTGVRKSARRRDWSAVATVTLHLGGRLLRGGQTVPTLPERQNNGFRQGFPDALRKGKEMVSDLVDGRLTVVMRCLRRGAPVSKRKPRP